MAKHSHIAKYYADDKDILDLMSAGKMTKAKLHEFARSRGIFVSPDDSENALVLYLHTLACSREQLTDLLEVIDSPDRAEKLTFRTVETDAPVTRLAEACNAIRDERAERNAEEYKITQFTENHIQVQVRYSETDHQRTRLLQRREKDLTIELERVNGQLEVRHQDNPRAAEVVKRLVKLLSDEPDKELPQRTISLVGIRIPKLRNNFFVGLMEGINGYELDDVVDVKVDKLVAREEEDADAPDGERDEGDSPADKEKQALESELKRVTLSGRGLLYSAEYQRLIKSEFFISRAVWVSKQSPDAGQKVEFGAEFGDPDAGEEFRYNVRGVWNRNEDGDFKNAKSQVNPIERTRLIKLLESSANNSLAKVCSEATTEKVEPQKTDV